MPRVCREEQLCVSCEFVTKFAVYGFFAEHRRSNTKRKAQDKLVEAILPVQMRVTTIADAEAKAVAPLLHPE